MHFILGIQEYEKRIKREGTCIISKEFEAKCKDGAFIRFHKIELYEE